MLSVLFALLLAVTTVTAKCGPLPLSLGRTWKMVVYGATNCSKSHYYEEFYGTLTTTGCYKIKITHNRLNEVKSFVFMGSDELRVNLHDNPSCSGKPFAQTHYSHFPSPYWHMNNVGRGPGGFKAFSIDSYGTHL